MQGWHQRTRDILHSRAVKLFVNDIGDIRYRVTTFDKHGTTGVRGLMRTTWRGYGIDAGQCWGLDLTALGLDWKKGMVFFFFFWTRPSWSRWPILSTLLYLPNVRVRIARVLQKGLRHGYATEKMQVFWSLSRRMRAPPFTKICSVTEYQTVFGLYYFDESTRQVLSVSTLAVKIDDDCISE